MKTKYILYLVLIIVFALSSCREITVNTIVNKDGSFTRVITITGDSSSVFNPDLPYPVDSTWIRESLKDTGKNDDYTLTYTKTFKNSKLLHLEIERDTGWRKHLDRKVDVSRSFGFFYSYLTFKQVIKAANPFKDCDYSSYLNQEDLKWLTGELIASTKEDSAKYNEADTKASDYLEDCITMKIIKVLEDGINRLDNTALNPQDVVMYKDSIKHRVDDYHDDLNIFIDYYQRWTGDSAVSELKNLDPPIFKELNIKLNYLIEIWGMEDYTQDVEMPGIIIETNSLHITGNKVSWEVSGLTIMFEDYEMYVESRILNKWAFVVGGIVLLLLIVVLIRKARK